MATTRSNSAAIPTAAAKDNMKENNKDTGAMQPKRAVRRPGTARPALGEIANRGQAAARPAPGAAAKKPLVTAAVKPVLRRQAAAAAAESAPAEEPCLGPDDAPLPEGVPDVDGPDAANPQLCAEYAKSIYAYLRGLEAGHTIRKEFLKGSTVNPGMRAVVVDWLVEVHTQFKLLQETLYVAVYLFDRYLQMAGLRLKRTELQLAGTTAMFIASKVEEMYAPELTDFVYIADSTYTAAEIKACELRMLQALDFNVSRPLQLHFLRRISKAGDVDMQQHSLAKYLMELCLPEYEMAHHPPSVIAAAALLLSLRLLQPEVTLESAWTPTLAYFSTYKLEQLLPLLSRLAAIVQRANSPKNQYKAVYTKYRSKKFLQVADIASLQQEVINKLAKKDFTDM